MNKVFLRLFCNPIFFALLLGGCVSTPVSFPEPGPELINLAKLPQKPVYLKIIAPQQVSAGNQYMLFVIPFGQISLADYRQDLIKVVTEKLLLSGYRPVLLSDQQLGYPLIEITHEQVSISAFDLLATRKINISAIIHSRRYNNRGLLTSENVLHGKASAYKRFAFSKQLDFFYQKALRSALEQLT